MGERARGGGRGRLGYKGEAEECKGERKRELDERVNRRQRQRQRQRQRGVVLAILCTHTYIGT